jgi:DNA-binding NtrC family response regulator
LYERILVADDDKDMCHMTSSILKKEGYKVDKAYGGEQAIRKVKARGYNLMILDYKLPDMDGINVFKVVHQAKPSLKVIMISAYGSPSIKSMAKKFGVYRFLDKPFNVKRLVSVVRDALAKSQGEVDRSSQGTVPDLRAKP